MMIICMLLLFGKKPVKDNNNKIKSISNRIKNDFNSSLINITVINIKLNMC